MTSTLPSPLIKKLSWWLILFLLISYFVTHVFGLTKLPVFADEAIYIRWTQLIMDDRERYAFFALNDGKTPLFMWLDVPLQHIITDQLAAGRWLSVLAGALQVGIFVALGKALGFGRRGQFLAGLASIGLPFWFFHHRMALLDGLLCFWLSLSWLALLYSQQTKKLAAFGWLLLSGAAFGLALLTKIPAILFAPALVIAAGFTIIKSHGFKLKALLTVSNLKILWQLAVVFALGLSIFLILKLQPTFGQLFSRGGDFLYPINQLNFGRVLLNIWHNGRDFLTVFGTYLSWGGLILLACSLLIPKRHHRSLELILMTLAYLIPIMIMGKVIYPRYLLPAAIPLTFAIIMAIENFILYIQATKDFNKKVPTAVFLAVLCSQIISSSLQFMLYAWFDPNQLTLTKSDQVQYLTEWSAGNGVAEVSAAALETAKTNSILVLTEGYFGTLPDGILLYLHNRNLHNLFVEGIGQPVLSVPEAMKLKAKNYDQVWLVVNSHRMKMNLPADQLITQYCRLPGYPCLQVWNLKPSL
jgi:4-amino-4-deoxy-L-arabinose transferase-like glycosyltransferase